MSPTSPSLSRVDYQKEGAGQRPAVAWYDPALILDPAEAIAARLNASLAWCKPERVTEAAAPQVTLSTTSSELPMRELDPSMLFPIASDGPEPLDGFWIARTKSGDITVSASTATSWPGTRPISFVAIAPAGMLGTDAIALVGGVAEELAA